jgi:putative endonuclease
MIAKGGWVYIMSSHSRRLYIGVTSDLSGRVWEHKNGLLEGFTKKYNIHFLFYHEFYPDIEVAIAPRRWRLSRK